MTTRTITIPAPIPAGSSYSLPGPINNLDVVSFKVAAHTPVLMLGTSAHVGVALAGTLAGSVYIWLADTGDIAKVAFTDSFLPGHVESVAPYDMMGTAADGVSGLPLDTTKFPDGTHSLSALVAYKDGTSATAAVTVTIKNAVVVPPAPVIPTLLFGLGAEADGASTSPLAGAAPLGMLSSWFNGTADLAWMSGWKANLIPNQYALGRALHLIVYASDATISATATKYGPANGRAYPLSAQCLADMTALAKVWAGTKAGPPLYVTLFTEFQTYSASRTWAGDPVYWSALKDAYRAALAIFHANAPNSKVSLCWGGWEARSSAPMFSDFADLMGVSDFQSFQSMESDTNVSDIETMTAALGKYGPVLLAHYKPNNASQAVFDADTTALFTDAELTKLTAAGLFGFSFMDQANLAPASTLARIVTAVKRYGKPLVPVVPIPVPLPPAPTNLKAVAGDTYVDLTWQ